jgi:serine/threonine protein kinase
MIGKTISHYKILEKLGEGGMGVIYKAQDTKLDRLLALKFLPPQLVASEAEKARFLQEAKAASALNHPNVCVIHDIQEADGQQFIVMEYVDGVTLRKIFESKPLTVNEALTYAIQIGEALKEAHSQGIVHRDIKSDNIMINSKNQVKVMDFGLAKLKGSLKLTKTSSTVGTLAYMAPEQIQGGEVDARSDIFSFGIVFYEMFTGRLPFKGEHEAAMMYAIINEEPEPIQKYRPELSSEFLHVINRVLEKDPDDRYQSMNDMLIDLRRLKKQTTRVVRTSIPEVSVGPGEGSVPSPSAPAQPIKPKSTKYFWGASVGIVSLLLILLVIRFFISPERRKVSGNHYPFHSYKLSRITTNGKVSEAVLSPDGKYIVYAVTESGKQSVWIRQVSAASSIQIIGPADYGYGGFTFSADGEHIYYLAYDSLSRQTVLFQIPVLGGTPRKLVSNISSPVAVSPDGRRFAFLRTFPTEGEEAMMVCNADGSDQQELVRRRGEDFFIATGGETPAWSPDGKTLACAAGSTVGGLNISLLLVSVADGSSRVATSHKWNLISRIVWTKDNKGIIMIGSEYQSGLSSNNQLWYLSVDDGEVHRITNDLNDYSWSLSITSDQSKLLVVQTNYNSNISILPKGDYRLAKDVTSRSGNFEGTSGLDWTPDGRLVIQSLVSGNADIWIMNGDGSNRQQLTTDSTRESNPSVSWEGNSIAYLSWRDKTPHVWRMDMDGSNQKQLTSGVDDYDPTFAPDSKWIFFDSYRDKGKVMIWKVPSGGGEPVKVSDDVMYLRGISFDGKLMLASYYDVKSNRWRLAVVSADDGKLLKVFDLPLTAGSNMKWMPDSKSLLYGDTRGGVSNLFVLPLNTMQPYQLTRYTTDIIYNFAWSKDGKHLAVVRGEQSNEVVLMSEVK